MSVAPAMPVALLFDPVCLEHEPGPGHPESPERLAAIWRELTARQIAGTEVVGPPRATRAQLERVHGAAHVGKLLSLAGRAGALDPDTVISPRSLDAALLAAGAAAEGVSRVLDGRSRGAFALVRPPGHHAESTRAMGFCLFNNVAVAAAEAHARGVERVLILDWDVHHGNGTQRSFYGRRDVLFASTHQFPFYPGTGDAPETGEGEGEGFTVNAPLAAGCDDGDFAAVFADALLPIADAYAPQLVLVSAGFDAHARDPLGGMEVSTDGFAALCGAVKAIADKHCPGKLVLTLEGGYDLQALAGSVRACVEVLAGSTAPPLQPRARPSAARALAQLHAAHGRRWSV
jgi:acetoin utilization deacetylase AcuC-like enzyme